MRRTSLDVAMMAMFLLLGGTPAFVQQAGTTDIAGGRGGDSFADFQPPAGARITEVRIRSGERVDSVQAVYALADGRTLTGPRHGGGGGAMNVVRLERDEFIIGLSGRCGDMIDSMRIHTNRRTSPLFGGRGGNRDYRIEVPPGNQATGFTGRAGDYLDAIGLNYAPVYSPRTRGALKSARPTTERVGQTPLAGGRGGSPFADQEVPQGARMAEIHVKAGERIDSIQAIYLLPDGRFFEGARHGGDGGRDHIFRLDPDEYVVGLSGRSGENIDSLCIQTNKRTSQIFGGRGGSRDYRIDAPAGARAIGFAGRAGKYLDAIGLIYAMR